MIQDLLFKEECFRIVGLSMKLHSKLDRGFKEIVYKDALEIEFINNKIPYEREKPFKIDTKTKFLSIGSMQIFLFSIQLFLK